MGKKRTVAVDDTKQTKAKKVIFKWEEAYFDLPTAIAGVLKEARVKPEQLTGMADGEVLAIEGMNPQFLEEIRLKYPATLVETESKPQPVKAEVAEAAAPEAEAKPSAGASHKLRHPRFRFGRSKLYKARIGKVENKTYSPTEAVELLKTISYSKHKTVELHLNVTESGLRGELSLPFSAGKEVRVAIFSDAIADEIKAGKYNFDILLARPADMGKIAPLAKILGPRGLMPSPKNGTITDNPEDRAKKLSEGGTLTYKTEAKDPLIHLALGNLDQKNEELVGNIKAVIGTIGLVKIKAATIKSTMSPGIRLQVA